MGSPLDDAINEAFGGRSFDDDPTPTTELQALPYQPPRLRITASYEPVDKRRPTGIEIEVFGDVELTPDTIRRITTGLARVIAGQAGDDHADPPATGQSVTSGGHAVFLNRTEDAA